MCLCVFYPTWIWRVGNLVSVKGGGGGEGFVGL